MCFWSESDWYADVVQESSFPATLPTKCDEMGCKIAVGETVHQIYQQQHETCRACEDDMCDCPGKGDDHECKCEAPDYGETYSYECCDQCRKFLDAVKDVETDEGCPPGQRQPSLCGMTEEIWHLDRDDKNRYFKRALRMFPELKASGYLGRLARRVY